MFPDCQLLPDSACSGKMRNFFLQTVPFMSWVNCHPLFSGVAKMWQPNVTSHFEHSGTSLLKTDAVEQCLPFSHSGTAALRSVA